MATLAVGAALIERIHMRKDAVYTAVDPTPFTPTVRPMRNDEFPYVIHSFSEGFKRSPEMKRKTWADFKALYQPRLRDALVRSDTTILVADAHVPGHAVGWIAFARWPSIDVVHWLYVARQFRRRGVARALLTGAALRTRVVHTHRSEVARGQPPADQLVADFLRRHGAVVSYVPYQEWSK